MLTIQPTIQIIAVFLAYSHGVLFLVFTSFASLWTEKYHQSVLLYGVHYDWFWCVSVFSYIDVRW